MPIHGNDISIARIIVIFVTGPEVTPRYHVVAPSTRVMTLFQNYYRHCDPAEFVIRVNGRRMPGDYTFEPMDDVTFIKPHRIPDLITIYDLYTLSVFPEGTTVGDLGHPIESGFIRLTLNGEPVGMDEILINGDVVAYTSEKD